MTSSKYGTPPGAGVPTHAPGSDGYRTATTPQNTLARQRPALVAAPTTGEEVAAAVRYAAVNGLTVVPQATGHGAAGELGPDVLLLDTSGLDSVQIDAGRRSARVGAGALWGAVDAEAAAVGLLGRAGSSPTVGVAGFTFGAGAGWLTRPWGLASGALTAVEYVDGSGILRRASDDAEEQIDRDVLWACRGGGGVGVAVALEFTLVPVDDLWAGYLIWPIDALDPVVTAWARSLPDSGPALATSLAILSAPPIPQIPDRLHGSQVVHLSLASSAGPGDAEALFAALAGGPDPAADTWGRADVERLGQIHLDPPGDVPGLGVARWLDDSFLRIAADVFRTAVGAPVQMLEVRNVGNDAPAPGGALDRPPGGFMLHAVGAPGEDGDTGPLEDAFTRITAAATPADTGLAVGSWSDGRPYVPDALPADVRQRVTAIADRADPARVLARSPLIAEPRPDGARLPVRRGAVAGPPSGGAAP